MSSSLHRGPVSLCVWASGREPCSGPGSAGPPGPFPSVPLVSRPGSMPTGVPAAAERPTHNSSACSALTAQPHRLGPPQPSRCGRDTVSWEVCGPQDHHLGVRVPQERAGALPCRAGCGAPCLSWVGMVHTRVPSPCRAGCRAPCLSCIGIVHTHIQHPSRRSLIVGSDSGLLPEGIRDTRRVLHGGGKTDREVRF